MLDCPVYVTCPIRINIKNDAGNIMKNNLSDVLSIFRIYVKGSAVRRYLLHSVRNKTSLNKRILFVPIFFF